MAMLFACPAELSAMDPAGSRFVLQVTTVDGSDSQLVFLLEGPGGGKADHTFTLDAPHGLDHATFSYETLPGTVTLTLKLSDAEKADLKTAGLAGFNFHAHAELGEVKIILRQRPQGSTWSAAAPCFTLMMCWELTAEASQVVDMVNKTGRATIDAGTAAAFELCASFSIISPPNFPPLGLHDLQLRLDLPSFSLSTDWVPLAKFIGVPDLPPFQLDFVLRWFGDMLKFNWGAIAFPAPKLPEWDMVDLPMLADLPLGIGADNAKVSLTRVAGLLELKAELSGFYLAWKEVRVPLPGEFRLRLTEAGNYEFFATLFRVQYPDTLADPTPYEFALPFDVLKLSADCWFFRAGLFSNGTVNGKHEMCFEVLLEIGGLELASSLAGDDGDDGFYRTDLRLLMRDFTVMSNDMRKAPLPFFSDVAKPITPFDRYAGKDVPALSFADDLLARPPVATPANDYGITFLDGDFRASERLYILWRQQGLRFLRALAHDLLGRPAAGAADPAEPSTLLGLEIAYFTHATQIRLDWRDADAPVPHENAQLPAPTAPPAAPACIDFKEDSDKPVLVHLPMSAKGVDLTVPPAGHVSFDFPAIRLEFAQPGAQAIVIRHAKGEADEPSSVSHVMFFPAPTAVGEVAPPLARAMIGFSMSQDGSGGDQREVVDTENENRFLTLGLGYAGKSPIALRTFGWAERGAPQFLQTLGKDAPPFESLIPKKPPSVVEGDPGCPGQPARPRPPAAFDFNAFSSPRLAADGWRLSIELAAAKSLFKMFKSDGDGQSVSFKIVRICETGKDSEVVIDTALTFALGKQFTAAGTVSFLFDVRDLSLRVTDGAELTVLWERKAEPGWAGAVALPKDSDKYWYSATVDLFGLKMTALVDKTDENDPPTTLSVLTLSIREGRFILSMPENGHILLRYTGLGSDTLNFWVSRFEIGPGGLDLDASLLSSSITVKGLSRPFLLEKATLRMRSSKLDYLSVDASGKLPELLNEAPVSLTIAFSQGENGSIDLDEMHCELGDKDTPILSRGTRFKFEISNLTIQYAREAPGAERQFFFELSGSAQFTPDGNEFSGGLLENLKSARIEFLRAPLSDDFIKNLSLAVELKRPVTFNVFSLFRMEIRSIGFEPWCTDLKEPGPAVIIGGQVEFAKQGDVVSAEISFHAMKIGMPQRGDWMPQVFFDKLRVDISTAGGFRIGGRVDRYDEDNLQGFAGEGTVEVPGFPELSAAFSFVRMRKDENAAWQHGWFIAVAAAKISYQVGPLPIYLRQIGLGFGYRFTLPLIAEFDTPRKTLREMIAVMMKAINEHHTLARIDSWTRQPGPDKWSIALEALITLGTANTGPYAYDQKNEKALKTMVLQVLAAFRSDFTILAGMKMWFPVSVDDFFQDLEGMHRRPLVSGFMIYSAPQNRFLAHAASGQDPYMGPPNEPVPEMLKDILRKSHYEATLLVEPGLIHGELGWPDRLMFDMSMGSLKLQCRGGVLFRLERDMLIQGTFFSANGSVNLGGALDGGFIGVRVEAFVQVQFSTRLMTAVYLANPLNSKLYAALGLDIAVRFSISAWLRLKIGFVKINLNASFSINLQIVVALELGWAGFGQVGFKGRARISIGVFGRSVGVSIAVGVNDGGVDDAKRVLLPYMGSLLGPGEPPPMPGIDNVGQRLAGSDVQPFRALDAGVAIENGTAAAITEWQEVQLLDAKEPAYERFVSAHVEGTTEDGQTLWFVWIMPGPGVKEFYPPGAFADSDQPVKYATLTLPNIDPGTVFIWKGEWLVATTGANDLFMRPDKTFNATKENTSDALPADLNLQRMIAGSWLPKNKADDDHGDVPFPFYWPGATPELVAPQRPPETADLIQDERVYDKANPNGAPNRRLDASHHYDNALMSAMDAAAASVDDSEGRVKSALGNQNFLLQAFHDDLVKIAGSTVMKGAVPATPEDKLAGLRDTGMLICVRSKDKPDWIGKLNTTTAYPEIAFVTSGFEGPFRVAPVIDSAMTDFALNPPVFDKARAYFDEDTIGLAWDLQWGGAPPAVTLGARPDIEAYLRAYRINFVDLDTQRVIKSSTVTPTRCDVRSTAKGLEQLDLRYRFTIVRAEVFTARADQRISHIGATITPISQGGQAGTPFTLELEFVPVLTPLPPDDAELVLFSPDYGDSWNARLDWRQLALPARPGVAITRGWHLILRPLRAVPLGAYPDDVADVTDRGLMSATGQALLDGDILIELDAADDKKGAGYTSRDATQADNDGRATAEKILSLSLHSTAIPGKVYDHRGIPQAAGSHKHNTALRFFRDRESAATRRGCAWRLFLRAANTVDNDERLQRGSGVSGLCQVKLVLRGPRQKNDADAPLLRTLPHFEWPKEMAPGQIAEVTATAGPLRVAVAVADGSLRFEPRPGRTRAVRIEWNALPSADGVLDALAPLQAFAAYDVHELRLETLVNADNDPDAKFVPEWRWLRRVVATDAAQAAQIPTTMADVPNWDAQYPAFAYTAAKLASLGVPARDMPDRWPGWYSWDESQLRWPDLPLSGEETAALPKRLGDWLRLGRDVTRVRLHSYLTLLIGRMAEQGRTDTDAVYDLQLVASKSSSLAEPLKWLEANTETIDPFGWAALAQLGLSATLTMRDPLTGMLLHQRSLRDALSEAIDTVTTESKSSPELEARVAAWRRHLMTELPIQYLRAYATADAAFDLDDAALSMLQVALRPVRERVASYMVFTVESVGAEPDGLTDLTDVRIDIRFPADSKRALIAVAPESSLALRGSFLAGDRVMLRDFSSPEHLAKAGPLQTRLEAAGLKLTLDVVASTRPFGLWTAGARDQVHAPFGVFGRPADLASVLLQAAPKDGTGKKQPDMSIVPYLVDAFVTSQDAAQHAELATALDFTNPDGTAFSAYINWAARFFRTAPIDPLTIPRDDGGKMAFAPATAIAQPKTADPLKIAADGKGRLSLTHFVEEEWAGERSYAVVTVSRYERLLESVSQHPEENNETLRMPPVLDSRRADVALDRVRRLAPPTLLLARSLSTAEDRYFHELVISHPEAALSQHNISVTRKLDFNDIVRSYLRAFLHPAWAANVTKNAGNGLQVGLPQPLERSGPHDTAPYDIDAEIDTLLAAAPQARWNTTRYVDAAEPFYYRQTLRYRATAATDIESEKKSVKLPSLPPYAVIPIGENPVSFSRRSLRPEWHAELGGALSEWLASSGHEVTVRLPRLVESLAPQARESYFAYECKRYRYGKTQYAPVGYLPDPNVRVLLLDQSASATATIAQLVPDAVTQLVSDPVADDPKDSKALFGFTALSADFATINTGIVPRTDWADGFYATFDVNTAFGQCSVDEPGAAIADISIPGRLTASKAEPLLAAVELPAQAPLSQLAPLAARMTLVDNDGTLSLAMTEPLTGPAWLCRPHLSPQDRAEPMSQRDLAIGLRMVADTQRRTLGALVAFDMGNGEPIERELLLRIEESALAILLRLDMPPPFNADTLLQWESAGITLWRRVAEPETSRGRWQQITGPDERVARYRCVLCEPHRAITPEAAQIREGAWNTLRDGWIIQGMEFDPDRFDRLSDATGRLAGLAYRRTPMRRPAVFIQRGNEERTPWPPQGSGEGESDE